MAIKATLGSTKAGVGKTTQTANLGGILADLRRKILLVDIDVQPTLSCDYLVQSKATIGFTHLITDTCVDDVISQVTIPDLDIVLSDDLEGRLRNVILPMPDGRVRLKHILIRLEDSYQDRRRAREKPCRRWFMNGLHTYPMPRFGNLN